MRVGKLKADCFKKRLRVGGVAATGQGLGLRLEIISSSTELALKDDKFIQSQTPPRGGSIIEFGGEVQ